MIAIVRVRTRGSDKAGLKLACDIRRVLGCKKVGQIKTVKSYLLEVDDDADITKLEGFAKDVLSEKIDQDMSLNEPLLQGGVHVVNVAYKLGVMNPESASIMKAAADYGFTLLAADTLIEYHFYSHFSKKRLDKVVSRLLVNKNIQRTVDVLPETLIIKGERKAEPIVSIRDLDDDQLIALSESMRLFLNLEEMRVIRDFFRGIGRDPKRAEVEAPSAAWSEHCGHKTANAVIIADGVRKAPMIKRLMSTARDYFGNVGVPFAFNENSGSILFYDGYAINGKVETHNSPSAEDPYGGAATGTGGVLRDIHDSRKGAEVVLSTDMFCFAPPDYAYENLPPGCLHPRYLFENVVRGVRDYGNRMGIPTANGSVYFDEDFVGKPSVIVGAYGLIKLDDCQMDPPQVGDLLVLIGGKTGKDGIHGATFSSGEKTAKTSEIDSTAVQIGNPIEEKRTFDGLLACRDKKLVRTKQDCGAAGLLSSTSEIGNHNGVHVYLEEVPLKYPGLEPWEILLSESQERDVAAVAPENVEEVLEICRLYNAEATVIGRFTGDGRFYVTYEAEAVCDLPLEFLRDGLPQRVMIATKPKRELDQRTIEVPQTEEKWLDDYFKVMGSWNVSSREAIVRGYDHGVQGTNVLVPYGGINQDGPNDAVILRPLMGKPYGMIVSHGLHPALNKIDPYQGSLWAITEALSNLVAVGGNAREVGLIDNFIWPFPDEESLWDLDQAFEACIEGMHIFTIPFVSGKDSLSSTYRWPDGRLLKIPPVMCISAMGRIPDVRQTVSADFKRTDSAIVLVGSLSDQMGGSAYYKQFGLGGGDIPKPNLEIQPAIFDRLHHHIKMGDILSCHDVSDGGVGATLAEMCFGGGVGANIDLAKLGSTSKTMHHRFFNEMAGCFLLEAKEEALDGDFFRDLPWTIVGSTISRQSIWAGYAGKKLFMAELEVLKSAWKRPIEEVFGQ